MHKAQVASLKQSLIDDELGFTFVLWSQFEVTYTDIDFMDTVLAAIVNAFVKSPKFLEVKIYLLMQVLDDLSYGHVDKLLVSMEERFSSADEDLSNSPILSNLNPIKTAVHMLMLLNEIEKRYSMAVLRTQNLGEQILNLTKSVLDRLFFPQQMSYQIRQIDLLNKNALYYLEHLDAFPIMETHIVDRVMQEYWQSSLDANGKFLGASTPYRILTEAEAGFDLEYGTRFYKARDKRATPHSLSFVVVRQSMQIRYFMETFFFFLLACYF